MKIVLLYFLASKFDDPTSSEALASKGELKMIEELKTDKYFTLQATDKNINSSNIYLKSNKKMMMQTKFHFVN